jgi:CRISPR type III-A-associated RAMP protein Csm4
MTAAPQPGLVVKFRPTGPWRVGPDTGARDGVDPVYHSDSFYSAVTASMGLLGYMDEWLGATANSTVGPAVRFSSMYPFHNEIGFVIPPRTAWPPPPSTKVRWKGARFVPLGLIGPLLNGRALEEDQWDVDAASQCLVPNGRSGPFRLGLRSGAAVDRLTGSVELHGLACVEFLPGAGMWGLVSFANEQQRARWDGPVRASLRLLADSGFGGERSRGWGRSEPPEFIEGSLPQMILPDQPVDASAVSEGGSSAVGDAPVVEGPSAYWLLSLFNPAPADAVDWNRGNYYLIARNGRVESPARSGDLKKSLNMVGEGSVLVAESPVQGAAADVAPDGFAHPVYRSGFALTVPVPGQAAS